MKRYDGNEKKGISDEDIDAQVEEIQEEVSRGAGSEDEGREKAKKLYERDSNSDKKIEQSQENGFSKEQAESAPNDVLVKDSKDADITLTDSTPENIKEVKEGNLDAKITPDSDFNLSPEMEKGLLANGGSKNGEKKDENAGKKLDLYNDSDEIINKLVDMGFDDKTAHKILSTIRLGTSRIYYDSDEINRVADFYKNYKKEKKDENAGKDIQPTQEQKDFGDKYNQAHESGDIEGAQKMLKERNGDSNAGKDMGELPLKNKNTQMKEQAFLDSINAPQQMKLAYVEGKLKLRQFIKEHFPQLEHVIYSDGEFEGQD